ncbi:hypothetical protein GCM10009616_18260 [Microlunatus lacustris]
MTHLSGARTYGDTELEGTIALQMVYVCDSCQYLNIGVTRLDLPYPDREDWEAAIAKPDDWLPIDLEGYWLDAGPDHIRSAAAEAHVCLNAGALRGAVVLARSVIEAVAKDKSITSGSIHSKIEALFTKGHISEDIRDTAHEIRFAGNDMAHGDFETSPGREDAEAILGLMGEVLQAVYVRPANLARIREKRIAKKAATVPPW